MKTDTVRRSPGLLLSHLALLALASQAACLGTADSFDDAVVEEQDALYGLGAIGNPWPGGVVPVCWQNGVGNRPELEAKVRWILRDTWQANANVTFVGWNDCSPTGNQVAISFQPPDKDGEFRGSTDAYGAGRRSVQLMDTDDVTSTGAPSHFRYEVIHEFGHVLGFAHEQQRPDNFTEAGTAIQCPARPGDEGQYAVLADGVNYTSVYDARSVMNYCAIEPGSSSIFVQNLSAGDIAGIRAAYGPPLASPSSTPANERGILWRQVQTGAVGIWLLDDRGELLTQAFPQPVADAAGNEWQIQGRGLFDREDGISDILWRDVTTGTLAIWFMSGGSIKRQVHLAAADRSWQIAATADFDRDGLTDILWRNTDGSTAIWFMNDGAVRTQAWPGRVSTSWVIQGTGDFDRDENPDILWRNTDGSTAIWFMNGTGGIRTQAWPGRVDNSWVIQGIGDFDRDRYADILWRNADGTTAIWLMTGGSIRAQSRPLRVDASWQIRGTGDFDADGTTDILWHNDSGQVVVWFIERGLIRTQGFPDVRAAYPWRIQGVLRDLR